MATNPARRQICTDLLVSCVREAVAAGASPATILSAVLAGGLPATAVGDAMTMVVQRGDRPDEVTLVLADTVITPGTEFYVNPDGDWTPESWRKHIADTLDSVQGAVREVLTDVFSDASDAGFLPDGDYMPAQEVPA